MIVIRRAGLCGGRVVSGGREYTLWSSGTAGDADDLDEIDGHGCGKECIWRAEGGPGDYDMHTRMGANPTAL